MADPAEAQDAARTRRRVMVTGGTRGIGAGIVGQLMDRGAQVAIAYASDRERAEAVTEQASGRAIAVRYVLGDSETAQSSVEHAVDAFGGLDGVIVNAGIWTGGRLSRLEPAEWDRVVVDTLRGAGQLLRASVPVLTRSAAPSITILSSVVGLIGGAGDTAYASAKAGLVGLGRSLAKELARDGVRVNVLAPGYVETDMTAQVSESARNDISTSIMLGRFGTVDEIASAAVYLSEDATYCTGSVLTVDGGWSI